MLLAFALVVVVWSAIGLVALVVVGLHHLPHSPHAH